MSEVKLLTSITKELLEKYAPAKGESINFPAGEFKFLGIVSGLEFKTVDNPEGIKLVDYGYKPNTKKSPACNIQLSTEDKVREIPIHVIYNMVGITSDDVQNKGTEAECVLSLGKTVRDILEKKAKETKGDIQFPKKFSIIGRFKSATKPASLKGEFLDNYKLQDEDGKTFADKYAGLEYAPMIFKNASGAARPANVWAVEPW